jgi:hypothetical protein
LPSVVATPLYDRRKSTMTFKSETAVPNNGDRAMGIPVDSNLTPEERVQNVLDIWGAGGYTVRRFPSVP